MQIWFTNKCKEKVLYGIEGIKFALKGYAFYTADLPDLGDTTEESAKLLELKDLDTEEIISNQFKNKMYLRDSLFDMTYIPAMESKIVDNNDKDLPRVVGHFGFYDEA